VMTIHIAFWHGGAAVGRMEVAASDTKVCHTWPCGTHLPRPTPAIVEGSPGSGVCRRVQGRGGERREFVKEHTTFTQVQF